MKARAHLTRVHGLRTHARVRGEGPPLVIVPGLGCASWMYARVSRALARERTVYAYDPPGHGLSQGRPDFPARLEDLTGHLAAWLEESGLRGAPVLGHSLGGEVVFDLAARFPALTGPLIACAPTGIPENPSVAGQLLRLARDLPRERPGLLLPGLAAYLRSGPARMLRLAADQRAHDTGPLLPRVRVPTLLLDGTADPVIRSWTVRAIRAAIPHAVVREVPGGTHALTDSHPRTVARLTLDFLRKVET
ncbi:alpha/beta fold hydrolase [Deinococcus planocerae]|uniref:alpha/beta fold hydrolase n=1 Tax=Deinococcus planocerae TaxID=1737569 RepID=UPI000C7EA5A5|nr:alpha/beta hydrolase [Deinococcus planocerae]